MTPLVVQDAHDEWTSSKGVPRGSFAAAREFLLEHPEFGASDVRLFSTRYEGKATV